MKQALKYSLKVWLTSVVFSPVLFILADTLVHPRQNSGLKGSLGFIAYSIPYGLVLSIPCWLFLFLTAGSLIYRSFKMINKMLSLSSLGIILSISPFYLMFRGDDEGFDLYSLLWSLSYASVIIFGVWFYELEPLEPKAIS